MSFVDTLVQFFGRPAADTAGEVPEGACGNCWGHFEYDGVIRDAIKDKQVDVNNRRESHAFIQKFVVEQLDGIQLKNRADGRHCARCGRVHPN